MKKKTDDVSMTVTGSNHADMGETLIRGVVESILLRVNGRTLTLGQGPLFKPDEMKQLGDELVGGIKHLVTDMTLE